MKTIKFRAWCQGKHDNLTFGKAHMEYGVSIGGKGGYLGIESGWDIHGEYLTVPLMQFTGLKDSNGKEIYEGDIVTGGSRVVWTTEMDRVGFRVEGHGRAYPIGWATEKEIIGNIYENKELMQEA